MKIDEISSLARISLPAAPRPGWGPGPPRRRNEIHPSDLYVVKKDRSRRLFCFVYLRLMDL